MSRQLSFIPPLIIFLIVLAASVMNFTPNTQLTGWDNLHPEFNFNLNIERAFFAPWQEYQGLGLVGGNGHAADLPRQLLLLISSLVIPSMYLRQFYCFLMLFLGPLGVYFILQKIIIKEKFASLSGALFYLLNLSTVQVFFTSFEPFLTQYGLLPWLFLAAFNYLQSPTKKNILLLSLVNIFAIPQAQVPTTFLVYLMVLLGSLGIFLLQQKGKEIKKTLAVVVITLFVNALWILPFIYFAVTNISVSVEAKMNQAATETVFLQNKEFGNIADVVTLRGYWFNLKDFSHTTQQFDYLMLPWREYLNNNNILAIGFILFAVVLLGMITAFRQKNRYRWILLFLFAVPVVVLSNNSPPFSWIDSFLYRFPFVSQALRSPFTKFSILASFAYSLLFAFGMAAMFDFLKSRYVKLGTLLVVGGLLITLTLPIFKGDLFYKQLRTTIPQDYQNMWNFFKTQNPNTRIAGFPVQTFFGWTYYRWGYSGSGFVWYGLPQPILDRAFDVWSRPDENYYWEVSYALYSNNPELFEKVLQKYQINWLLVDNNVIYPTSPKSLHIDELKQLISSSNKISLAQKFGQIEIYQTNFNQANNFVYLSNNLPKVGPKYNWNNLDLAYSDNGDYISSAEQVDIYYPFRTLFTGKTQQDREFTIEDKGDKFIFQKNIPADLKNSSLELPEISNQDKVRIDNNSDKSQVLISNLSFNNQILEVTVPKVKSLFSTEIDSNGSREFWLPNLPHDRGYLITVQSSNLQGTPLNFWIENIDSRKADLETYLPEVKNLTTSYYIQPPMDEFGLGYSLHFDQGLLFSSEAKNTLGKIEVYPIPFNFLTSLKLKSESLPPSQTFSVEAKHTTPWLYQVDLPQNTGTASATLVLSQAYDSGWVAFNYPGEFPLRQIKGHLLINNWANGWVIDKTQKGSVYIVFWPQLLEWIGLLLLMGTLITLSVKKYRSHT